MCQDLKFEISKVPKDKDLLSTAAPEKNGGTLPKINVDLTALIRSVQRSEGNPTAFAGIRGIAINSVAPGGLIACHCKVMPSRTRPNQLRVFN